MRRWLKRIGIALGVLVLAVFLAVGFGGRWAADHYLGKEIAAGPGKLRLYSPDFKWSLDLQADSAYYLSPDVDARISGLRISGDLFRSLLRFGPSARLEIDTLWVSVRPGPDTVKPRPDSIPFPDFRIPTAAAVRIGRIVVRDTASGSLAPLLVADGVAADTRGDRAVSIVIGAGPGDGIAAASALRPGRLGRARFPGGAGLLG